MPNIGRTKPPDELVNKRGGRYQPLTVFEPTYDEAGNLVTVDEDGAQVAVTIPEPPSDVGEYATEVWKHYWLSPIAQLADINAHGEALRYWIRCVHQRAWMWEQYKTQPLVLGSKKQPMANPLWRQIRELGETIRDYEEAFGMTPLAQMRLGVEFLTGKALQASLRQPPQLHKAMRVTKLGV